MDNDDDDMSSSLKRLEELLVLITKSTHNRYIALDEEVDEESVKQWFYQLIEDFKMTTSGLDYQARAKGHTYIVPQFFKLLQECFLTHNWQGAVKILQALAYEPKGTSQTIWKAGMEVMYSNAKENDAFISQLFRQLKLFKDLHAEDVILEYVMYLLQQGRVSDAAAASRLKDKRKSSFDRTVNLPAHPPFVYKAYKGLVYYIEWLQLKHSMQGKETEGEMWQSSSQANYDEMKIVHHAKKAIKLMDDVCDQPGVWDTFIVKLTQMKEEIEGKDAALSVLTRYRDQNPDNPNSHRYIYDFYVKHGSSDEDKIGCLKGLVKRDPSNPLILKLCNLLNECHSVGSLLFNLLDYCNWQHKLTPWKKFRKYLQHIYSSKLKLNISVVEDCWRERESWWPAYHFTLKSGGCADQADIAVLCEKAACAAFLMGKDNTFTAEVMKSLDEAYQKKLVDMLKTLDDS
ncbi:TATA box-binding protein-associated factor RNA polymerase I subunit A-like isoform X1 [Haliotis rufescens]|uniref:TATA box-binding protein-associated factor RNA polymerase I subunit A-like isoform X1 n=2 Tax=Haliotis rufescens TaxID=6454 RepID=UPI001EAFA558|nr:TATA box-binding protein-associated factor RNA polymerase I subunit A-like isoform X1 [Haliotis rufescens]